MGLFPYGAFKNGPQRKIENCSTGKQHKYEREKQFREYFSHFHKCCDPIDAAEWCRPSSARSTQKVLDKMVCHGIWHYCTGRGISKRYPAPRTVLRYRGFSGSVSIFSRMRRT